MPLYVSTAAKLWTTCNETDQAKLFVPKAKDMGEVTEVNMLGRDARQKIESRSMVLANVSRMKLLLRKVQHVILQSGS